MQLFLSGLGQIVFWAVILSAHLVLILNILISRRHTPPLKAKFRSGASASTAFRLFLAVPIILVAISFGYTGIGLLPDWAYFLGISLSILGFDIVFWGQHTLGRYYSAEVVIYEGHQLVERGPYRFVRHPIYTGTYLGYVGIGLAVQSWVAAVVILIVFALLATIAIRFEEKVLISEFGEQYIAYSKRVKQFIPFIF